MIVATTAPKQRTRGRPFPPGQSGNRSGRAKGSRNRATVMAEALSDGDAKAIARAVVAKARKGNLAAAKLVLDRLWPAPKGRSVAFELPATTDTKGIMEAHSAVVCSLARGSLTPDEADAVSRILVAHLRMIEAKEIEARLEALEAQQARECAP